MTAKSDYLAPHVKHQFFDSNECNDLIGYARSQGMTEDFRFSSRADGRTGIKSLSDEWHLHLQKKIKEVMGIEGVLEPPEIVCYEKDSPGFPLHFDGPFRSYTIIVYLNDVEEGGETEFPNYDLKVKPIEGTAIFWRNAQDGTPLEANAHKALLPASGEKWILVGWILDNDQPLPDEVSTLL